MIPNFDDFVVEYFSGIEIYLFGIFSIDNIVRLDEKISREFMDVNVAKITLENMLIEMHKRRRKYQRNATLNEFTTSQL